MPPIGDNLNCKKKKKRKKSLCKQSGNRVASAFYPFPASDRISERIFLNWGGLINDVTVSSSFRKPRFGRCRKVTSVPSIPRAFACFFPMGRRVKFTEIMVIETLSSFHSASKINAASPLSLCELFAILSLNFLNWDRWGSVRGADKVIWR